MKKILYFFICVLCLSSVNVPCANAQSKYIMTMSEDLVIEIEDNVPEGREAYVLSTDDASGGKMVGSGWGETDFNGFVIPVTVEEAGYYNVEFVESRYSAGSFSRIDGYIRDESNTTTIHGFNMNAYPQVDPDFTEKEYQIITSQGTTVGFGNTMIKQKYTNIWFEEGIINVCFDIHRVGDHTNFAIDYFKFSPVVDKLSMQQPTTLEFENYVSADKAPSYVVSSQDAGGGKMVRTEWGATDFTLFSIPIVVTEAGYYDAEFVESRFVAGDGYSRIDGYIADNEGEILHGFNNNAYPQLDTDFESKCYDGYTNMMIKQKYDKIWLDEGKIYVCFEVIPVGDHTHFALDYFRLTPYAPAKVQSIKIGSNEYGDSKYHRSSDIIILDYDVKLNTDIVPDVRITDGKGSSVSFVSEYDENDTSRVLIKLIESLKYSETYFVEVSGLVDKRDFTLEEQIIEFETMDSDETVIVNDILEIEEFSVKQGVALIKGNIKASHNLGISGRGLKWYITFPGEERVLVKDNVLSVDKGLFEFSYTLDDDNIRGEVISVIESDYALQKEASAYYVSDTYMLPILEALKSSTDWQNISSVLTSNQDVLGIDIELDLAGTEQQGFYEQFVGVNIGNIDEFRNLYRAMLALEKINQATDISVVESAITAEGILNLLEEEHEKLDVLEEAEEKLYSVLLDMDRIKGMDGFKKAFETAFNSALMFKDNLDDIVITIDDLTLREGEESKLYINANRDVEGIKRIVLTVAFDGNLKDNISDLSFESTIGEHTIVENDNLLTITVVLDDAIGGKELGKLKFVGNATGIGTVVVSGEAISATSTKYDAKLNVFEEIVNVTVIQQKKQPIGGGSIGGGGGGKSGFSTGGSVLIPQDNKEQESVSESKDVFVDLDDVSWAKEYITGLYNIQAISRNDEAKFYPTRNITRAEFIKIVVLANDIVRGSLVEVNFDDVNEGDWYYQYVEAAVRVGLVKGNDKGRFCPDDYITREDICVILSRLTGVNTNVGDEKFTDDSSISDYAREAVYTMKQKGIVNGIGDNMFAPGAFATRAEAAKIIYGVSK